MGRGLGRAHERGSRLDRELQQRDAADALAFIDEYTQAPVAAEIVNNGRDAPLKVGCAMPPPKPFQSIQCLRAVAAIGVVVHHALDISLRLDWALGAVGIDIFFVISGFVMYVSINDGTRASGFLVRRLWRIYPLYWIATGVYFGVLWWMYGTHVEWIHLLRSLALFPPEAPWVFPVLFPAWTLIFEMVFYACLAAAIALTRSRDRAAFVAGALLVLMGLLEYSQQPFAFLQYVFRLRLCEFALGLLCAYFWSRGHVLRRADAFVLLAVAMGYLLLHPHDTARGATPILVWGLPSAAIVFSLVSLEASGVSFNSAVNRLLGEASYAIYLFHPVVLAALWKLIAPEGATMGAHAIPDAGFFMLLVAASVAAGCVAWWLLDRPIQRLRRRFEAALSRLRRIKGAELALPTDARPDS